MRNLENSDKQNADDSSTINRLPDEIILQILNKLIDLKTLCFCYLVSRRFSSVVLQVGAISFTASLRISDNNTVGVPCGWSSLYGESFHSVNRFLSNFKRLKSLRMELPYSCRRAVDNCCLFKWKVRFSHRIESFIFLASASICDKDGSYLDGYGFEDEENQQLISDMHTHRFAVGFFKHDVVVWHIILLNMVKNLPLLEEVSITDSGKRGRLSLSGEKLNEVKKWVKSASESEMNHVKIHDPMGIFYSPVLELPGSGCVMKGIYGGLMEMKDLQDGNDFLKKSEDGVEGKEEAAFTEAMMQILENHRGKMRTYNPMGALVYESGCEASVSNY